MSNPYSLTKIVATIGPASESAEMVEKVIQAGMNVARLNCSHGDWDVREARVTKLRAAAKKLNRPVGILVDLQGPKIRTGTLPGDGVEVVTNEEVILTTDEENTDYISTTKKIFVRNYPELPTDVEPGQRILLDDGKIRMEVISINGKEVTCRSIFGGLIKSNKGVNLPDSHQKNLEAITPKDKEDIKQAVKYRPEFIALSFVRCADDIIELKKLIADAQAGDEYPVKIVAKIEKPQAIEGDTLDRILEVVDGVMVARGDLGVEVEPERVPMVQKLIIEKANIHKKFVITATQMMDSMINNPFPTRAEVSDVANAILDGTDAVMLSNETAMGSYPVEAVDQMRKIALEVEAHGDIKVVRHDLKQADVNDAEHVNETNSLAIAQAVENLAKLPHINNILVFTCSGKSASKVSKLRPNCNILAATTYEHTFNYLSIVWGVTPVFFDEVNHTTNTIYNIEKHLIESKIINQDETIVVTGGLPIAARGQANFVKLHTCDGSIVEMSKRQGAGAEKKLGPKLDKDAVAI